jgi:pre-rRNA-processing protein TSR3
MGWAVVVLWSYYGCTGGQARLILVHGSARTYAHPLLLLDSTWRWLPQLAAAVRGTPIARSIPGVLRTAYPRTSRVFEDPAAGLASIEALYVARKLLGDDDPSLLDGYHWREPFLANLAQAGL